MRGNKRTFPNFHICFLISMNSNSFQHQTLERRWHDFFHLKWKGCLKNIWIPLGNIFQFWNFMQLNDFMREDKMTSSNIWNMSWKFKRIKFKVLLEIIFNLELFGFYSNYFSPKIKYMEIRVTWFPTIENWRKNWNHFGIFKMILVGF